MLYISSGWWPGGCCTFFGACLFPSKTLKLRIEMLEARMYTREITIPDILTDNTGYNYDYMQEHYILLQHYTPHINMVWPLFDYKSNPFKWSMCAKLWFVILRFQILSGSKNQLLRFHNHVNIQIVMEPSVRFAVFTICQLQSILIPHPANFNSKVQI